MHGFRYRPCVANKVRRCVIVALEVAAETGCTWRHLESASTVTRHSLPLKSPVDIIQMQAKPMADLLSPKDVRVLLWNSSGIVDRVDTLPPSAPTADPFPATICSSMAKGCSRNYPRGGDANTFLSGGGRVFCWQCVRGVGGVEG